MTATGVLLGSTYLAEYLPSPDYRPLFGVVVSAASFQVIGDLATTLVTAR